MRSKIEPPSESASAGWVVGAKTGSLSSGRSRPWRAKNPAQSQQPVGLVDPRVVEAQLPGEKVEHLGGHARLHLEAHHPGETLAGVQHLLHGLEQVVGLGLGDLLLGAAGHPKGVVTHDVHAGEEGGQVGGDDLLHGHQPPLGPHFEEPGEQRGHLDSGEAALAGCRIVEGHRQVHRKVGDEGEGVGGVEAERGEHGVDVPLEHLVGGVALLLLQVLPGGQVDAVLGQAGDDLVGHQALGATGQGQAAAPDGGQQGRRAGGTGHLAHPGGHLFSQRGHAHLEELVEVRGDDGDELHPLQQGDVGVLGNGEHPLLEVEERQLTVGVAGVHGGWRGHRHGTGRPGALPGTYPSSRAVILARRRRWRSSPVKRAAR